MASSATPNTASKDAFKTFTNPTGRVLKEVTRDVWSAERPFIFLQMDVGGRMALVRLADGSLWAHSPVALDPELKAAVDALGPVRHVVSPNYEHTKFAQQWLEAYPEARGYACPGLMARKPDVRYSTEVRDSAPPEWLGEIEPTWLSFERNPFNGKPFFNEVVFLHKPSRMLITTDLFWNYPGEAGTPVGTRIWKVGMDQVYLPFYRRFMIKDKEGYERALGRILRDWDWDAALPCHGGYVPSGGKAALAHHLGWRL